MALRRLADVVVSFRHPDGRRRAPAENCGHHVEWCSCAIAAIAMTTSTTTLAIGIFFSPQPTSVCAFCCGVSRVRSLRRWINLAPMRKARSELSLQRLTHRAIKRFFRFAGSLEVAEYRAIALVASRLLDFSFCSVQRWASIRRPEQCQGSFSFRRISRGRHRIFSRDHGNVRICRRPRPSPPFREATTWRFSPSLLRQR